MASVTSPSYDGRYYKFTVTQGSGTNLNWTFESIGGNVNNYACAKISCKINNHEVYSYPKTTGAQTGTKPFPISAGSTGGSYNVGSYGTFSFSLEGQPYNYGVVVREGSITTTPPVRNIKLYIKNENADGTWATPRLWIDRNVDYGSSVDYWGYGDSNGPDNAIYQVIHFQRNNITSDINETVLAYRRRYTISYNLNGGDSVNPTSQEVRAEQSIAMPTPSKSLYDFMGWANSASATSGSTGNTSTTSNKTLYATWRATKPKNVSISRTSSSTTSITLNWSSTAAEVSYTVYYKKTSASSWNSKSFGSSTSGTLSGLSIDTNYNIYVTASNPGGNTSSSTLTYSTLLVAPTLSSIEVTTLEPFKIAIRATGTITPTRILKYRFSYDNGTNWTNWISSNSYFWDSGIRGDNPIQQEHSYAVKIQVRASAEGVNASDTYDTSSKTVTTPLYQARIRIKKNDTWRMGWVYYKKDGEWKRVKYTYTKKDGSWKIAKNPYKDKN